MGYPSWPVLLLPILLAAFAEANAQEPVRRLGKHYELVFHVGDLGKELASQLADECRADLDAFGTKLGELTGKPLTERRTIHLYRDEAEYRAAEKPATTFEFETNGFVSDDLVGYALMQPLLAPDLLQPTGVPGSTVNTLHRVAAELGIAPLVPNNDRQGWLRWLLVMGAVELASNPTHRPGFNAAHDYRRTTIWTRRVLFDWEFTLEGMIATEMRWDQSWQWRTTIIDLALLAQCLSEQNPRWARRLLQKHKLPRGQSGELARRTAAVKTVVGRKFDEARTDFAKMITQFESRWHASRGLWEIGDRRLLIGPPNTDGIARRSGLPKGDYAIRARFEIGPGRPNPVMISVGPDGLFRITAWFNNGEVGFSRLNRKTGAWDSKAYTKVDIKPGMPFDFEFAIGKKTLRLAIDGEEALTWDHDGGDMHSHAYVAVVDRVLWIDKLDVVPLEPGSGR